MSVPGVAWWALGLVLTSVIFVLGWWVWSSPWKDDHDGEG